MLAKLEQEIQQRDVGLTDRFAAHRKVPIAGHVADYRAHLISKGRTEKHADCAARMLTRVFERAGIAKISGVTLSPIQAAVAGLTTAVPSRNPRPASARTKNCALGAVKAFAAWLEDDGRIDRVPKGLAKLARYNEDLDRRHERRALSWDEVRRLLVATEQGAPFRPTGLDRQGGMRPVSGVERAALYRLALGTGFRRKELKSLTPECFRLDGDDPYITLAPKDEKNRNGDAPAHYARTCGRIPPVRRREGAGQVPALRPRSHGEDAPPRHGDGRHPLQGLRTGGSSISTR